MSIPFDSIQQAFETLLSLAASDEGFTPEQYHALFFAMAILYSEMQDMEHRNAEV